tara:strand:+ start:749 stop:952 length:204 start_codon:yes stop_codon:yes gene_type:complete
MVFKYTEEQYNRDKGKLKTLEIRYDQFGDPVDSLGNPIGGITPIMPADPNAIPQIRYLGKNKNKNKK